MGKWTKETSGMEVLRQTSKEALKIKDNKLRVWNDSLESWGFFEKEIAETDNFLIWCAAVPGDRLFLREMWDGESTTEKGVYTILAIWKDVEADYPIWKMRLISQSGRFVDIQTMERRLFECALKMTGMR